MEKIESYFAVVESDCAFICLSYQDFYNQIVSENVHLSERPFLEILCYSDSTDYESTVSLIPNLDNKETILWAWNVNKRLIGKLQETYKGYKMTVFPRFQPSQCIKYPGQLKDVNFLILICGKLGGMDNFTLEVIEAINSVQIRN